MKIINLFLDPSFILVMTSEHEKCEVFFAELCYFKITKANKCVLNKSICTHQNA